MAQEDSTFSPPELLTPIRVTWPEGADPSQGAALVVIAHRLNILGAADKLLVLRDGAVDLYGPRREVLQTLEARVASLPRAAMT